MRDLSGGNSIKDSEKVVAIVVTYNPDINILKACLQRAAKQTCKVIVVDNFSQNVREIVSLCKAYGCDFVEIGFNAGVPCALQRGVSYAQKYHPHWILFLDQDCILLEDSVSKALSIYSSLPENVRSRVGILALGSRGSRERCSIREITYGAAFSGTLIKNELLRSINLRVNLFLDHADYDLYKKVIENGKIALVIDCKMMHHRIGTPLEVQSIFKLKKKLFAFIKMLGLKSLGNVMLAENLSPQINYEPPKRYYYIVRNSLILLRDGEKNIIEFLSDVVWTGIAVAYIDGFTKMFRSLCLGLMHGILGREGRLMVDL